MGLTANGRRPASLSWGSTLSEPLSARFQTRCRVKENKPGIVIADECLAIEDIQHYAHLKWQGIVTPPTPGAIHDAIAVYQTYANSTGGTGGGAGGLTITLPTAMFFEEDTDGESDPVNQSASFRYTGTSLQPRIVS